MNRFDYIQFITPLDYVINPNHDLLSKMSDVNGETKYALRQGKSLISEHDFRIVFNLNKERATIGFSAKILGNNYHKLIGSDNIEECLDLFSIKYGLCHSMNIPEALRWGECNKLEVTKDIPIVLDRVHYQSISNAMPNTHKWKLLVKRGVTVYENGFGAMRTDNSESLIMYGKEEEMTKERNRYMVEYGPENSFIGLTRIEAKLNTMKAIRNRFKTDALNDVLESEENPLIDILTELFANPKDTEAIRGNFIKAQRDRERLSYAREFDYNIGLLADDLRRRQGKNWRRELKPIIEVMNSENQELQSTMDLIETIKHMVE